MAQTRSRSATSTKAAAGTRAKGQRAGTKPASRAASSGRARSARKPTSPRPARPRGTTVPRKGGPKAPAEQRSNGHLGVDAVKDAVAGAATDAGHGLRRVTRNAKTPLLAGGAALAGAAGGVALGATRKAARLADARTRPRVGFQIRSEDLARTAKELGSFGEQLGMVATELGRAREAAAATKHRSPIEVVLQGLTARR